MSLADTFYIAIVNLLFTLAEKTPVNTHLGAPLPRRGSKKRAVFHLPEAVGGNSRSSLWSLRPQQHNSWPPSCSTKCGPPRSRSGPSSARLATDNPPSRIGTRHPAWSAKDTPPASHAGASRSPDCPGSRPVCGSCGRPLPPPTTW